MPTLFHSRLQRNLVNWINQRTDRYEAIQELRCIIPPISPVPDITVIAIDRLPTIDGPFDGAPDWLIEIRSTKASSTIVYANADSLPMLGNISPLTVDQAIAMTTQR